MIDPEDILSITESVLGQKQAADRVNSDEDEVSADVDTILASTEKILAISRGMAEPDERDSLEYRRVHSPDKLFAERVELDANKLRQILMRRLARQRSLKALPVAYFDPYVEGMVVGHPLSSPLEEINPLQLVEQARRVTAMGPGGLGSSEQITSEAQNIHPSTFGFISAIEGPECHSADTEVYTEKGWKPWPSVTLSDKLACLIGGCLAFHWPSRLIAAPYQGRMIGVKSQDFDFLITPNHRMWSRRNGSKKAVYQEITAGEQFGQDWKYATSPVPCLGLPDDDVFEFPVRGEDWVTQSYAGKVYCATVPGGLLFTKRGRGVGFWSGNSERIGIDTRLAWGARLGSDGRIYQRFINRRSGKPQWLSPNDLTGRVVGLPD